MTHPSSSSPNPQTPFSSFFVSYFDSTHPTLAPHLRSSQLHHAASVYLFRYSHNLSTPLVTDTLASVASSIADAAGISVPEAKRMFTNAARNASHVYFSSSWQNVAPFVMANAPELVSLQKQHAKIRALLNKLDDGLAPDVDAVELDAVRDACPIVVAFVYADYCSVCKAASPRFAELAEQGLGVGGKRVRFVKVNGPKCPDVKAAHGIRSYPALLRFQRGESATMWRGKKTMGLEEMEKFARGEDVEEEGVDSDGEGDDDGIWGGTLISPRRGRWAGVLRKQGIDELEELATERNHVLHDAVEEIIKCGEDSCHVETETGSRNDAQSPLCVLLGGGMGAGKTTAVGLMTETSFWKKHGESVVVVEADAFKMNDPLFQVLRSVTPLASRIVHQDSLKAAEELFVQAVNGRRDIVYDGTLSWSEYARQTVDMLKDTEYFYKRGPGYQKDEDGEITEEYWVRTERRKQKVQPYRVELVGVTVDAEVAVMRGIVRRIIEGRGVPIPDQLHSHALFSRNFEGYVDMVDAVYLFDTSLQSRSGEEKQGYEEQLVAVKQGVLFDKPASSPVRVSETGEEFVVKQIAPYERFLKKKMLNMMASSAKELYPPTVVNE